MLGYYHEVDSVYLDDNNRQTKWKSNNQRDRVELKRKKWTLMLMRLLVDQKESNKPLDLIAITIKLTR